MILELQEIKGIGAKSIELLNKLNIFTLEDLFDDTTISDSVTDN